MAIWQSNTGLIGKLGFRIAFALVACIFLPLYLCQSPTDPLDVRIHGRVAHASWQILIGGDISVERPWPQGQRISHKSFGTRVRLCRQRNNSRRYNPALLILAARVSCSDFCKHRTMSDNGGRKTIRYNVGGQIFEVSHAAVNRHPTTIMAKKAVEFSQNGSAAAIFIDGNAERFGYVLDYLRCGHVVLPSNIPKAVLLQDLNYYGFQFISMDNVDDSSALVGALAQIVRLEEEHKRDLEKLDVEIAMLQLKRSYAIVAHECFRHYIQNGISTSFRLQGSSDSDVYRCFFTSEFKKVFLMKCLRCMDSSISHTR